jgi:hypothetical protein
MPLKTYSEVGFDTADAGLVNLILFDVRDRTENPVSPVWLVKVAEVASIPVGAIQVVLSTGKVQNTNSIDPTFENV